MTTPTPAEIAGKLTKAQQRVMLAMPLGGRYGEYEYGWWREWGEVAFVAATDYRSIAACISRGLIEGGDTPGLRQFRRLTAAGLAVREHLAATGGERDV